MLDQIRAELSQLSQPDKVKGKAHFFQNGPGQYAEGDKFLGIGVPALRSLSRRFKDTTEQDIKTLLTDEYHEVRFLALLLMVNKFRKAEPLQQDAIVELYLSHTAWINNWDLVDVSCYDIVGPYCYPNRLHILERLALSDSIWERRMAMVSTYHMIKLRQFDATFSIASLLLPESHEIVQKAIGWMLKEISKRDLEAMLGYVDHNGEKLSALSLRTALEKVDAGQRQHIRQKIKFRRN